MTLAAEHMPNPRVTPVILGELGPGTRLDEARTPDALGEVEVVVAADAGHTVLKFQELLNLQVGEVFALDRTPDTPVDIRVNGTLVARGDVVIVDEEIATRISEVT